MDFRFTIPGDIALPTTIGAVIVSLLIAAHFVRKINSALTDISPKDKKAIENALQKVHNNAGPLTKIWLRTWWNYPPQ